jgi:hypothetical protein
MVRNRPARVAKVLAAGRTSHPVLLLVLTAAGAASAGAGAAAATCLAAGCTAALYRP